MRRSSPSLDHRQNSADGAGQLRFCNPPHRAELLSSPYALGRYDDRGREPYPWSLGPPAELTNRALWEPVSTMRPATSPEDALGLIPLQESAWAEA